MYIQYFRKRIAKGKKKKKKKKERRKYHCKGLGTLENRAVARLEDSNIND